MVAFPDVDYAKGLPKLVRSTSVSRSGKRAIVFVEFADPYWQIDVETAPLERNLIPGVQAFLEETGSGLQSVLFAPSYFDVPQAYLADPANAALADNGNLVSGSGGTTLAINGVTSGLDIRRGDMISLISGAYRSLHRIMAGAVASGGAFTLVVEPFVPTYIAAGAVVKFKDLELNTRVVPGSENMTEDFKPVATFTLVETPI